MIKIKISNSDLIKSKLQGVISAVEGFYQEAKGDCEQTRLVNYSSEGVLSRMKKIKDALYSDIERFADDIEYVESINNITNDINNSKNRQSQSNQDRN
jgi:uncharacterized Fe-S cluster-containing protein